MDKIIGVVWRFGKNDYQISLTDYDKEDQEKLLAIDAKYEEKYSCERGNENLTIKAANAEFWEDLWDMEDRLNKRKELATRLYDIGMIKTQALYDHQADEDDQMSIARISEALTNPHDAAYLLEVFLQFCDGSQEKEDTEMFFKASMDIVHYMEGFQKGV